MNKTSPEVGKVIGHPAITKTSSRRKRFNPAKSRLPVIVLILLLVYVTFSFSSKFNTLYAMQQDVKEMQEQVELLSKKNDQLRVQMQKVKSDAYVEEVAREKLGLVKAGEVRIVPSDSSTRD